MTLQPALGFFDGGRDLASPALYETALAPFGAARTLPRLAYRSKAFSDLEDEQIWTRDWVCIGYHARIPNPGDLLPHTVGNHGIHVRRRADGGLGAFFNFAQHGGCRFVPRQCQTGTKTSCFYTSCGQSRDRDVVPAAADGGEPPEMYMFLGNNPARQIPVAVATAGPWVFVNLDPGCGPLEAQLGPAHEVLRSIDDARPRHVLRFQEEPRANWKTAARVFVDQRHDPARGTQGEAIDFAQWSPPPADDFVACGVGADGRVRFGREALAVEDGDLWLWVFPNLLVRRCGDHVLSTVLQPTGLAQSLHLCDLFHLSARSPALREDLSGFWQAALASDAARATELQVALAGKDNPSPFLPQPPTAFGALPETNPLAWSFHRYLVDRITTRHTYVDRPLYSSQPGLSLNAGVNAGAY